MDQTVAQLIELLDTCGQRLHALLAKLTKDRDGADAIDKVIREETTEQVLVAMESLSEEDRELISLRFIQEESNQWIAQS